MLVMFGRMPAESTLARNLLFDDALMGNSSLDLGPPYRAASLSRSPHGKAALQTVATERPDLFV